MADADTERLIVLFDRLAAAGFPMNADWNDAHDLCQRHEGQQAFDWAHALCHRIEGDEGNADYWYRRAGRDSSGSLGQEWRALREQLATSS